jgi:hypothetical protein
MQDFQNIEYSVIPYNQEEIELVLRQLMLERGITDVLYEGSNVSQISSIISYLISTLNINTAINLQETLLPLATKRMNILFGARQLGYEARPKISYKYTLTLRPQYPNKNIDPTTGEIDKEDDTLYTVELNHNTKFICGSYEYWYTGPTIPNFWEVCNKMITEVGENKNHPDYDKVYKEVIVKEGKVYTPDNDITLSLNAAEYQDENGEVKVKQDYLIPYKNVEEDGISVYLTYVDEFGRFQEKQPRYQTKQYLIDENMNNQKDLFARAENIILGVPTVFFQMGGFGNPIRNGTLLEFEILVSAGAAGEAIGKFRVDDGNADFIVYQYELYSKGQEEETNDSIKENAIVYHNTANRAVTKYDYNTIIKRHNLVSEGASWGGEDEDPKEKGHIWISCIPATKEKLVKYKNNGTTRTYEIIIGEPNWLPAEAPFEDHPNLSNWFLTPDKYNVSGILTEQGQQGIMREYLDEFKMMTIEVHYRHPLYVNFDFTCDIVKYNVTKSMEQVNKGVFDTINEYFDNVLEKFDSEYLNSNLQRVIDKCLGYTSGITYNIKTTGSLCAEMIDEFNLKLNELETYECPNRTPRTVIKCSLAFPFENIYYTDISYTALKPEMLPIIDTDDFGMNRYSLRVDYADLVPVLPNANMNYLETEIYLMKNGTRYNFGTYAVNKLNSTIDLTFEFGAVQIDDIFPKSGAGEYNEYIDFNIKYPYTVDTSTNIPFTKNSIARLRSVTFIDN